MAGTGLLASLRLDYNPHFLCVLLQTLLFLKHTTAEFLEGQIYVFVWLTKNISIHASVYKIHIDPF